MQQYACIYKHPNVFCGIHFRLNLLFSFGLIFNWSYLLFSCFLLSRSNGWCVALFRIPFVWCVTHLWCVFVCLIGGEMLDQQGVPDQQVAGKSQGGAGVVYKVQMLSFKTHINHIFSQSCVYCLHVSSVKTFLLLFSSATAIAVCVCLFPTRHEFLFESVLWLRVWMKHALHECSALLIFISPHFGYE